MAKTPKHPQPICQAGFSLVEMMIAMVLGLIVLLAAGGSFLASQKVAGMAQAISKNQESSRLSFEMMARDLRIAGSNPCSAAVAPVNVLNNGQTSAWWRQWSKGVFGFDAGTAAPGLPTGTAMGSRLSASPVLDIYTADDRLTNLGGQMTASNGTIPMGTTGIANFRAGDLAVVCDTNVAFLFQVSGVTANAIRHAAGNGAPGNCSSTFSASEPCSSLSDGHRFGWDAQVGRASGYRWYLGTNEAGTTSLWRARITNGTTGNTPSVVNQQEIARGIENMTLTYMVVGGTDYTNASSVLDWGDVESVRIQLTLTQDVARASGNDRNLQATTSQIVSLRNR